MITTVMKKIGRGIVGIPTAIGYTGLGYGVSTVPQAVEKATVWYDFLLPSSFDDVTALVAMITSIGLLINKASEFLERRKDKAIEREERKLRLEIELEKERLAMSKESKNDNN